MYDIRIFLENNWSFWARVNAGKEIVYGVWENKEELMKNIEEWLQISFQNKKRNKKVSRIFSYISSNKKDLICH